MFKLRLQETVSDDKVLFLPKAKNDLETTFDKSNTIIK